MSLQAFCWLGLRKAPDRLAAVLALLPDDQRAAAREILAGWEKLPQSAPDKMVAEERARQTRILVHRVEETLGPSWQFIAPLVRRWVWYGAWRERYGEKDT